jgi:hypothetical protein
MDYSLVRFRLTDTSTIGKLLNPVGGLEGFTLEDVDRGLDSGMPLSEILKAKVPEKTAIPYGRYKIVIDFSDKFQRELPHILGVPGFSGIRIHPGNTAAHTAGCPLIGEIYGNNEIYHSRRAFGRFFDGLKANLAVGECWIAVKNGKV